MKTTNEGFLVNTLRRLPRHGAKALAAGAILIAATLPLAMATDAGAATFTSVYFATTTAVGGNAGVTGQTLAEADSFFGSGASGEVQITGTGFQNDGGTVTVTSNAPGLTFSGASESSSSVATASFQSTSATAAGIYSITVTDNGGTYVDAGAFTVKAAPSVSSLTTATLTDTAANATVPDTLNGAFESPGISSGIIISATNTTDGTHLTIVQSGTSSATSIPVNITPENPTTSGAASPGTYILKVTYPDGGTVTTSAILTIVAAPISNLSPSAFAASAGAVSTTILGTNFVSGTGFYVWIALGTAPTLPLTASGSTAGDGISAVSASVTSPTTITLNFTATGATPGQYNIYEQNANGTSNELAAGLGIGGPSGVGPTVTSTSVTAPITPGSAQVVTFTGTGLSSYTTAEAFVGTSATAAATTIGAAITSTPTSVTYLVSVTSGVGTQAGANNVVFTNGTGTIPYATQGTGDLAAAFNIAGPAIVSQTPAAIVDGTAVGTIITLTGTGFLPTLASPGTVVAGGTGFAGVVQYVNATTLNLLVTASPTGLPSSAGASYVQVSETGVGGSGTSESQEFALTFASGPTVTGLSYVSGTTGVGVGATGQVVTLTGSSFATGTTLGTFINASGVADPNVTAKVLTINAFGTSMTAAISIAAGDLNTSDGYTLTNANGGTTKVNGFSTDSLIIQPAPVISAVTPATATANSTTSFTLTGTGFSAGVSVAATADGTCGAATLSTTTTITVSCTFGAATAAAALAVTNTNGGTATSATVLAAGAAATTGAPHATSESGNGVVGHTVHIAVVGVGFYGQPHVTSTGNSVKAVVSFDNGTRLTVVLSVGKTTGAGEHTLTFTLANGKVFKVNYKIVK